jgi:hypothetical protein
VPATAGEWFAVFVSLDAHDYLPAESTRWLPEKISLVVFPLARDVFAHVGNFDAETAKAPMPPAMQNRPGNRGLAWGLPCKRGKIPPVVPQKTFSVPEAENEMDVKAATDCAWFETPFQG